MEHINTTEVNYLMKNYGKLFIFFLRYCFLLSSYNNLILVNYISEFTWWIVNAFKEIFINSSAGGFLIALLIEFSVNSIECFRHHIFIMLGSTFAFNVVNMMYVLIVGETIYPNIDWVTLDSYIAIVNFYILACGAYAINDYFWKYVKLPLIIVED